MTDLMWEIGCGKPIGCGKSPLDRMSAAAKNQPNDQAKGCGKSDVET